MRRTEGLPCDERIGTADQGRNTWKKYVYICSIYSRRGIAGKQRGLAKKQKIDCLCFFLEKEQVNADL